MEILGFSNRWSSQEEDNALCLEHYCWFHSNWFYSHVSHLCIYNLNLLVSQPVLGNAAALCPCKMITICMPHSIISCLFALKLTVFHCKLKKKKNWRCPSLKNFGLNSVVVFKNYPSKPFILMSGIMMVKWLLKRLPQLLCTSRTTWERRASKNS